MAELQQLTREKDQVTREKEQVTREKEQVCNVSRTTYYMCNEVMKTVMLYCMAC